ncbi:MAG TPA: hypothetical protein P5341_02655 [Hyphomonas sp.]|nr:hypothetical protein [Hyphomonas sp.]
MRQEFTTETWKRPSHAMGCPADWLDMRGHRRISSAITPVEAQDPNAPTPAWTANLETSK